MTKAKAKSLYHKGMRIPTALVDELLESCLVLPTQEEFGFCQN